MRAFLLLAGMTLAAADPTAQVVSVKRIWNEAPHSAFGDIIRFKNEWFVVFREGKWHAPKPGEEDDGVLRVIRSTDGERWRAAARIQEQGIDLRDPHLSVTAENRWMIVAGGSQYPKGHYQGRQPRVMFSVDGENWTKPRAVLDQGHWLWRVTWHGGRAWGISKYGSPSAELASNPRRQRLVSSRDGVKWVAVAELDVPGGDEATVRFLPDGRMAALMRNAAGDGLAYVGTADPPYKQWRWVKTGYFVGGPNFVVLPSGVWIGGGRLYEGGDRQKAKTAVAVVTPEAYEPLLTLPSGGDNSYPGFYYHDGLLWTLYYSSHEGNTGIYLAKLRIK